MKDVEDRSIEDVPEHLREKVMIAKDAQKREREYRHLAHEQSVKWRRMVWGYANDREPIADEYDPELLEWIFYLMGVEV